MQAALVRIECGKVDDDEVEEPVSIIVDEGGGGGPVSLRGSGRCEAGLAGDVAERAVAVVVEELVGGTIVGYVDVGETVVVDVTDGDPSVEPLSPEAASVGDLDELAVGGLAKQAVGRSSG